MNRGRIKGDEEERKKGKDTQGEKQKEECDCQNIYMKRTKGEEEKNRRKKEITKGKEKRKRDVNK